MTDDERRRNDVLAAMALQRMYEESNLQAQGVTFEHFADHMERAARARAILESLPGHEQFHLQRQWEMACERSRKGRLSQPTFEQWFAARVAGIDRETAMAPARQAAYERRALILAILVVITGLVVFAIVQLSK